jgi:prevent-host-death family protein
MKLSKAIKPVSYVKAHLAEIIRRAGEGETFVVTQNGEAKAVILDVAEYDRIQDALTLRQLLDMSEADIRAGRTLPLKEAMAQVRARVRKQ